MLKAKDIVRTIGLEFLNEDFIETTVEKLQELRDKRIPYLVIKRNGRFFYTKVDKKFSLPNTTSREHRCAINSIDICHRLSAKTDENGGCRKVRDGKDAHIEKYEYIRTGYETVNTEKSVFIVMECDYHEDERIRERIRYPVGEPKEALEYYYQEERAR